MPNLLIVDDDANIRTLFQFVAEDLGHAVTLAANGQEALAALAAAVPDFMILDVDMPVLSGDGFIRELAKRAVKEPHLDRIPFLVMTGENFMETGLNSVFAKRPGFVCFLPKMTPPETVMQKIAEVLGG